MFGLLEKNLTFVAYVTFLLLTSGCDPTCPIRIETVHLIQNLTVRKLSLVICNHGYGTFNISVAETDTINEVGFGVREEKVANNCPRDMTQIYKQKFIDMSLDSKSVDSVKLCYDESINTYFLIETSQSCSAGQIERSVVTVCKYPL